jgi:hypothetical protein
MKVIAYINNDDVPTLMTAEYAKNLEKFFGKSSDILFVVTMIGQTHFEVMPEVEKKVVCKTGKCRNCGCDPYEVRDHSKDKVKSVKVIDGKLDMDTGF